MSAPSLSSALDSMKATAIVLILVASTSQADECLGYAGTVRIEGTLSRHTFPEQPGYESIANGDAKATYFFLSPSKPICVAEGSADNNEPAEPSVRRVQLVFASDTRKPYDLLRPSLGKKVSCSGSIYHAISGHHHSPVLLGDAKCIPVQQGVQPEGPASGRSSG